MKATISPDDAVDKTLSYSSSNTDVATVSSDGNILGVGSGTAKIKATAKNGVSSSIQIKVYSPVTDLVISTENCVLQVGEEFKLNVSVLPEDADNPNITFKSENDNIVTVDSNGNLIGVTEGETNVIITSEDSNISKTVEVTVIRQLGEGEIVFDDSLEVNANQITGLENKNNTVDSFIQKIKTNYTVEIYNSNGDKIDGNSLVGTGSKVKILDSNNNNALVIEYNVIMYGDVNGDGKINSIDLLVLQRHILEIKKLDGVFVKAGNVRKNNKNPSSVDCLLIQRHILGLQVLEQ